MESLEIEMYFYFQFFTFGNQSDGNYSWKLHLESTTVTLLWLYMHKHFFQESILRLRNPVSWYLWLSSARTTCSVCCLFFVSPKLIFWLGIKGLNGARSLIYVRQVYCQRIFSQNNSIFYFSSALDITPLFSSNIWPPSFVTCLIIESMIISFFVFKVTLHEKGILRFFHQIRHSLILPADIWSQLPPLEENKTILLFAATNK